VAVRRGSLPILLLLIVTGCEDFAYTYDYRGTLLKPDGTPAAGVDVSVQPSARHSYAYEKVGPGDSDVRRVDLLDHWATTTDERGRFSGNVNGDSQYTRWLCLPTAPAAARLQSMYVWVRRPAGWSPIVVPLDEASQARGYSGGRHVDLPAVTLPPGP
jgi:hypothetical protein